MLQSIGLRAPLLRTTASQCTFTSTINATKSAAARHLPRRFNSTAPTATTNAPTTTSATAGKVGSPSTLDWNSFLRLRLLRRRYNIGGSIIGAFASTVVGLNIIGSKEIDPMQTIYGFDPIMVLGLGLVGCAVGGWLLGPALGGVAFRIVQKKHLPDIAKKEKEFFQHIKKHRVDPSFQSFSNPVPDYYGEKIGSLTQYRQWLKDQRAYNRKREKFL